MPLEHLALFRLDIPFHLTFRHSSAARDRTQSLWVEAKVDGSTGRGEGCPREYVTSESLSSASAFFAEHERALREQMGSVDDLSRWAQDHAEAIDANPAAWCAIELAVLEAFALRDGVPIETVLGLPPIDGEFAYSAVVSDSGSEAFRAMVDRYHQTGFTDFKLKLSGDVGRDQEKLRALSALGIDGLQVRVDANNLWPTADAAAAHLSALDHDFIGVEEPLPAGDLDGMRELSKATGHRIILDESLLRAVQVRELESDPERWILNLRVSKLGGLMRSLDVATRATQSGIAIIVGAQVGETSVLSRAALPLARAAGDALVAQEGAFGTLLLQTDVAATPLMFGARGLLDAGRLELARRPGWGLSFIDDRSILKPLEGRS